MVTHRLAGILGEKYYNTIKEKSQEKYAVLTCYFLSLPELQQVLQQAPCKANS